MLVKKTKGRERTAQEGRERGQLATAKAPAAEIAGNPKRTEAATLAGVETWPG